MSINEKLKDFGRQLIGQGEEVKFKNEVAEYERTHGVSKEEATKSLFFGRLSAVQAELGAGGIIDSQSKGYAEFRAAANEIFGSEKLSQFSRDSADPAIFRAMSIPTSNPAETARVREYFGKKFKGRVPTAAIIKDSSDSMKTADALLSRLAGDPRFSGSGSIESVLSTSPDLGADLGKLLALKEAVERHEKFFDKDLKFEEAMRGFKHTAENSLTEMFWKAPTSFMSRMLKRGMHSKGLGGFIDVFATETTRLAQRTTWAGAKFLASSAFTAGSYVKNKVAR